MKSRARASFFQLRARGPLRTVYAPSQGVTLDLTGAKTGTFQSMRKALIAAKPQHLP